MRRLFLVLFFGSICNTVLCQLHFDPFFQYMPSETFGVQQVLSQAWDKQGRIWMSTDKGIVCYNGYSSQLISAKKGSDNSLLSNNIQTFFLDSRDWLWIAYADVSGISRFNTKNKKFTHFLPDSSRKNAMPPEPVVRFVEDSKSRMWIAVWGGGMVKLDPNKGPVKVYKPNPNNPDDKHALPFPIVKAITELKDGRFLLGFFGESNFYARPHYFDPEKEIFEPFPAEDYVTNLQGEEREKLLASLKIDHFIYVDKSENIWFGTYSGLCFFDLKNKTARRISGQSFDERDLNLDNAKGYVVDEASNSIWVTTPNKGIMVVDFDTKKTAYLRHSVSVSGTISDNRIKNCKKDPDGNIWVLTAGGGLNIYCPFKQQFSILPWTDMKLEFTYTSEQTVPVNQMLVRNKNEIFVSSENGISVYNPETRTLTDQIKLASYEQSSLANKERGLTRIQNFKFIDNDRILVVHGNVPKVYNMKTKKMLPGIIVDPNEKLWWQGHIFFRHKKNDDKFYTFRQWPNSVFEFDVNTQKITRIANLDKRNYTDWSTCLKIRENYTALLPSGKWMFPADASLWSGSCRNFFIFDPLTKESALYGPSDSDRYFPDSLINNVHVDPDKNVWVLTENGIYRFDEKTGKAEHWGSKIGTGNLAVRAMITDEYGVHWLGFEKKIGRWDPKTNKVFVFDEKMGMPLGSILPSVAQTDGEGKIYMATMNGVLMFDPDRLTVPTRIPELSIESLVVRDDTLDEKQLSVFTNGKMQFSWDENFLNIYLRTNQVYAPAPHRFYYRLVGLDSAWIDNGFLNHIRYPNLSDGSYVLEVKLKNAYDIESKILRIPFTIKRPFWKAWWFYLIVLVVVVFAISRYIRYRETVHRKQQEILERKVEERTAEVVEKAKEISHQKDIIEEKNKELTDSIHYAERIQRSILPDDKTLNKNLPQHFVLFRPKDIVSGDFYWHTKQKDSLLWAVVDCTGHGVPGGFMSMLGAGLLNQIVNEELKLQPDIILNELRDRVIIALKQTGALGENRDGMDITLCRYIPGEKKIQFAGANNSLYILRKGELTEYSPDKQPIGIYVGEKKNFSLKEINVEPDDLIYMTSDGYADQFGGDKGKKFKTANFEKLLKMVSGDGIGKQKQRIEETFEKWKGDYEQLDDVCVFGVKI